MKERILVYALPALIRTTIHFAEAPQQAKVFKIGFLGSEYLSKHIEAVRQGLRNLGHVEGGGLV
jgi:hypothetical protein